MLECGLQEEREAVMKRKTFTPEQIFSKLLEADVLLSQGQKVAELSRKSGITEQTYYRWRREYGGMQIVYPNWNKRYSRACRIMAAPTSFFWTNRISCL
jgi:hypothetical protein